MSTSSLCRVRSPHADRLGNGPYIEIETCCLSVFVFEITNWNTRNVIHYGFDDAYVSWLNIAYSGGLYYTTILFFGD
jgi:hypothetical protein